MTRRKKSLFVLLFMVITVPYITEVVNVDFSGEIPPSSVIDASSTGKDNIPSSNGYSITGDTYTSDENSGIESLQGDKPLELGDTIRQPRLNIDDAETGLQQLLQSSVTEHWPTFIEDHYTGRKWIGYVNYTGSNFWGTTDSDLYGKYTEDGGASWSDPVTFLERSGRDGSFSITFDGNGTMWLFWWSDYANPGYQDIWVRNSTDSGFTWSTPFQLTNSATVNDLEPCSFYTPNGSLWIVFFRDTGGVRDLLYITSPDNGISWSNARSFPLYSGINRQTCRSSATLTPNGTIFMYVQEISTLWASYVYRSADNGQTWTKYQATPHENRYDGDVYVDSNFTIFVIDKLNSDGELYTVNSTDGGYTWTSRKKITTSGGNTPDTLIDSVGNLWLAFTSSRDGDFDIYYNIYEDYDPPFIPPQWDYTIETSGLKRLHQSSVDERDPWVFEDNLGRIWVVYQNSTTYLTSDVDIYARYTGDSGKTWSNEITLIKRAGVDGGSGLTVNQDGTIWFFWCSSFTNGEGSLDIWGMNSTDNGFTWSTPFQITDSNSVNDGSPLTFITPNGTIWVVFNRNTGDRIYYVTSADNGMTWSSPKPFPLYSGYNRATSSCTVTDNGTILVYVDELNTLWAPILYRSDDNGQTWSKIQVTPYSNHLHGTEFVDNQFNLHVIYHKVSDKKLYYVNSTDGGSSWSTAVAVSQGGTTYGEDFPDAFVDSQGILWITLTSDRDGDWDIYYNRFSLSELPILDSPADIAYEEGITGHSIIWNPSDFDPHSYNITRDGTLVASGSWNSSSETITISVDGLGAGTYIYRCSVNDTFGQIVYDEVMVTVLLPSFSFVTKWGSNGAADGQFDYPTAVAINSTGYVFVVDVNNDRIQVFDTNGNFLFKRGTLGTGNGQFDTPVGISINASDYIYVADTFNHRIQVFDANCNYLFKWGTFGTGDGQFNQPYGLTINASGYVYVADSSNSRIQVFDSVGNFIREWGSQGSGDGQFGLNNAGLAFNSTGHLFIADRDNHRIQVFDASGNYLFKWGSSGSGDGQFNLPHGIAVGPGNYVYVPDHLNHRVQVFYPNGTFMTKWGSSGSGDGEFNRPYGMTVNSTGYSYVTDYFNSRIQVFSPYLNSDPPTINSPADISYIEGSTANSITWNPSDYDPLSYNITRDGVLVASGSWNISSETIAINVDELSAGIYIYSCSVNDTHGQSVYDEVTVTVTSNTPPEASAPAIIPSSPLTGDDLAASYIYFDADSDPEVSSKIIWYRDSAPQPSYENLTTVPSSTTSAGEEWYFTVQPSDGSEFGSVYTSPTVTIVNSTPTASDLSIAPITPASDDDLVASYIYHDDDGDPEGVSLIIWYRGGVAQVAYENLTTVPSSTTVTGEDWYFTVQPYDGKDYGIIYSSSSVTINTPPEASALVITPSNPLSGDDLFASYTYGDTDGDSEGTSKIVWYRDGVAQTAYENLTTVPSSTTSVGEDWYFTVQPYDGSEYGSIQTSPVVTINTVPTASGLYITPSNPLSGDDLVASYTYHDIDGDSEGTSLIIWYRGGVAQVAYENLTTVPSSATSAGEDWFFTVRPFDGKNYGSTVSSPTVTINTPPVASDLAITPGNPLTGDDLIASYTYNDADGDSEGSSKIIWYRDGVAQSAYANLTTIPFSATAAGEYWNFTIQLHDSHEYGNIQTSPTVVIGNTVPAASDLTITPGSPTADDDLIASYTYHDDDGDPESGSEVQWYKDDVLQAALNGLTAVPSSYTSIGDVWYFRVHPSDGTDYGNWETSSAVIIGSSNIPPTASDLAITPVDPITSDDLVASYVYFDANSDLETGSLIRWYKNGVLQPAYENLTSIPSSATNKGDSWYFTVRPYDGENYGSTYTSATATIGNTAPVASDLAISPEDPADSDDLIASYTYFDIDGDSESTSEIIWFKDGVLHGALNGSLTVSSTHTTGGETWYFQVRPFDGTDYGNWETSSTVVIITVPGFPLNLNAVPGNNLVYLSWEAPSDNGGAAITEYRIYRGTSSGSHSLLTTLSVLTYTDNTVTNGLTYFYVVTAVNAVGESDDSNEVETIPRTVPSAPVNLVATAGDNQVSLSWQAPADNGGSPVTGYNIYRKTSSTSYTLMTSVTGLNHVDDTASNGVTYYYVVTAVNIAGESPYSNEASATPEQEVVAPDAPANLAATSDNNQVSLSWQAPVNDGGSLVTEYAIYRGTTSGSWVFQGSTTSLGYTDTTVAAGQTYYYVVTAVNSVGESPYSNEAVVTVGTSSTSSSGSTTATVTFSPAPGFEFIGFLLSIVLAVPIINGKKKDK